LSSGDQEQGIKPGYQASTAFSVMRYGLSIAVFVSSNDAIVILHDEALAKTGRSPHQITMFDFQLDDTALYIFTVRHDGPVAKMANSCKQATTV